MGSAGHSHFGVVVSNIVPRSDLEAISQIKGVVRNSWNFFKRFTPQGSFPDPVCSPSGAALDTAVRWPILNVALIQPASTHV